MRNLCESDNLEMFVKMREYLAENDFAFEEIKPHFLIRSYKSVNL